jgi:short-subunit dehydrogenase
MTTQTAIIFGAGSGLGTSMARKLGKAGYSLALLARRQSRLDDLAARLRAEGFTVATYRIDLDKPTTSLPRSRASARTSGRSARSTTARTPWSTSSPPSP